MVKKYSEGSTITIEFLSHLCGGEANAMGVSNVNRFLSHLCGGEGFVQDRLAVSDFLSHLCGGEVLII